MQILVHTDMKSTKKPYSKKKPQNQYICDPITYGIQLQTFPQKCNTRKHQAETWPTEEKGLLHTNVATIFTNTAKMKGRCTHFPSFIS